MSFFQKVWKPFADFWEGVWDDIRAFLKPMAREIAQSGGKLLLSIAMEAVRQAEAKGGSGRDKLDYAIGYTRERLEQEGQAFVLNAVFSAVMAAVAQLHEEQGQ